MNRSELYYKTITTLNDAWRNGHLRRFDCKACAVGNMLGGANWGSLFCTTDGEQESLPPDKAAVYGLFNEEYVSIGVKMIRNSGYTRKELMQIEFAFETSPKAETEKAGQYNGLCAVFDILQQIHDVEFSIAQTSKDELDSVYELLN